MSQKRVGQILKEAREEKKLTVKEVSKETNIAIKYIIALETEDYSQFPAETFALGFLKNYGSFLKLDTGYLMDLYRGEQLEELQPPLEELTRPTTSFFQMDQNKILIMIAMLIAGVGLYIFYNGPDSSTVSSLDESEDIPVESVQDKGSNIPSSTRLQSVSLQEKTSTPLIFQELDSGYTFGMSNQKCSLFLRKTFVDPSGQRVAEFGFHLYPERNVYYFQTKEGDSTILSDKISDLSNLAREVRVSTQVINEKSSKVTLTLGNDKEALALGEFYVDAKFFFVKETFFKAVVDGVPKEDQGLVEKDQFRSYIVRDRLEIFVGNGEAVEMEWGGRPRVKLGKPGRTVRKVYVRSLDSSGNPILRESE
jgi:cytoskeletal protein RodZ